MKKFVVLVLLLSLCLSALAAEPLHFVFGDMDQHAEIAGGFLPTYLLSGFGYDLPELLDGNRSEFQILFGIGYLQRKLWLDANTGAVITEDPIIYDTFRTDWMLRLKQGLGNSTMGSKDLFTFTLAYEMRIESSMNSMVKGRNRMNPTKYEVRSLDSYIGDDYSGAIYPDLQGNRQFVGHFISFQTKLDQMDDRKTASDGFLATFDFRLAPEAFNESADFFMLRLNAVAAKTLIESIGANGRNSFSITLIDRANVTLLSGDQIPVAVQGPASLGRLVRGFNPYSYGTELSAVNNFDIRFAGPDLGESGIFPRINLFYDVGFGSGHYYNSTYTDINYLSSCGVQVTVSFFDFIDLGYQIAYLIKGDKYSEGPDRNVVGSFTFFLDF